MSDPTANVPSPGIVGPTGAGFGAGAAPAGALTPVAFSSASARVGQSRLSCAMAACCLSGCGPASVQALRTACTTGGVVALGATDFAAAVLVTVVGAAETVVVTVGIAVLWELAPALAAALAHDKAAEPHDGQHEAQLSVPGSPGGGGGGGPGRTVCPVRLG